MNSETYQPEPRIYRIRRYRYSAGSRTLRSNVTLTEAQSHCSNPNTKGNGWFDGYDYMPGCAPKK
jgi:hypothetical protein